MMHGPALPLSKQRLQRERELLAAQRRLRYVDWTRDDLLSHIDALRDALGSTAAREKNLSDRIVELTGDNSRAAAGSNAG